VKKLNDISIASKLYIIVGAMAVLIVLELLSLWFAIHTLSAVRTLVGAEGLWSKAQKDAVYQLRKYNRTHDEADYREFQQLMQVPLGDHTARLELLKKNPDLEMVRKGFLQGRVHAEDIDGVISLLRRFHQNAYISKALATWAKGDSIILQLGPVAEHLHQQVQFASPSHGQMDSSLASADAINQQLTLLEDDFSYTLGEGSRWLENLVLKILLCVAVTVEFTGLFLTILVTRGITRHLAEIISATRRIVRGDWEARAKVFSQNEIGQVATEVNQMTAQLIQGNRELEEVAYFASHDLQQPLAATAEFIKLFEKQYGQQLDATANGYLQSIAASTIHMQTLVRDMLNHSRIGTDRRLVEIDCHLEVEHILEEMKGEIAASQAIIHVSPLPVINGYFEMRLLFQNLLGNAVKFCHPKRPAEIFVSCRDLGGEWLFMVKDNGIGIEKKYHARIFTIFQRLHSDAEYPGTGIGLAHCKKIVELHRGSIWLTSRVGEGSCFYVSIPKAL